MKFKFISFFCILTSTLMGLEVATLHPLVSDLAREVGGDRVNIIELVGPDDDPHAFDPKPETLTRARDARLILASGKGLEASFLGDLQDGLRPNQEIFEVGRRVPSLVPRDSNIASCCAHHVGAVSIDPHWWHDVQYMRRAARYLANEFARVDPENASYYRENAASYREQLQELDQWIKAQVAKLPRNRRILSTSHLAFGYFCQAYDFKALGIQGIHKESSPSPAVLAGIILYLQEEDVPVLFPEYGTSPKALEQIAADAGVTIGTPLYADGVGIPEGEGYVYMMRHNVEAIVSGLGER